MDLVIVGARVGSEAVEAFRVATLAHDVLVRPASARLLAVGEDAATRQAAAALAAHFGVDAVFVPAARRLADFRVLAMDMDSTLINIECVDEIAVYAGQGAAVAAITEAAMRGEIVDYQDSLRRRVALLAGLEEAALQRVYDERLRLNAGAARLIEGCRAAGLKTLLVSGGFTFFTERLRDRLHLDATWSNVLEVRDGRLTGAVSGPLVDGVAGPIVDAQGKRDAVEALCSSLACTLRQAIVIGDGANDLKMMDGAGLAVAYRAKPVVQQHAGAALNHAALDAVLELLG